MNRREFIKSAAALAAVRSVALAAPAPAVDKGRILVGVCHWGGIGGVKTLKDVGFDYWEWNVGSAFAPGEGAEWWKRQKELILSQPLPLMSCNGFLPGSFRLTGPNAEHGPALDYAETALRRAEEVGVRRVVLGSGGARSVPGGFSEECKTRPDVIRGYEQFTDFCRELTRRIADLKTVEVVLEPLSPNETNLLNYVWQGVQICQEVASPRLAQLADIYHMLAGRESPRSIVDNAKWIRHCHVASYPSRSFPGSDAKDAERLAPYFKALAESGYEGGVSCECSWGNGEDYEKNLAIAIKTVREGLTA